MFEAGSWRLYLLCSFKINVMCAPETPDDKTCLSKRGRVFREFLPSRKLRVAMATAEEFVQFRTRKLVKKVITKINLAAIPTITARFG